MGEVVLLLVMGDRRAGVVLGQCLAKQRAERVALVLGDGHEAPRCELAMVGHARGDGEDAFELLGDRAGADKFSRLGRAAGFEERQSG